MVLRVTLPITEEGHYVDAPEDDTETALMGLLDTISNLEESLALAGKSEWMEAWDSDYPRLNIDDIINLEDETLLNYFQKGNEKVGKTKKEVWRFAIQGSTSPESLVRSIKTCFREANFKAKIDINAFADIGVFAAGWLSGTDPDLIQRSVIASACEHGFAKMNLKDLQPATGEEESDPIPTFTLMTNRYSAIKRNHSPTFAPVIMVLCEQKNLTRVRRLFSLLSGDYFTYGYNDFVSTKNTMEARWEKLVDHITFISSKQCFHISGKGLDEVPNSTVLSSAVTLEGSTRPLQSLLAAKGIFSFIQNSRTGGSKIICQHDTVHTIHLSKLKSTTIDPKAWMVAHVIKANDPDPAERLDWKTKNFDVRHNHEIGQSTKKDTPTNETAQGQASVSSWKEKWKLSKPTDEKSVISKLSSTGESIETIRSQLTEQQEKNKILSTANNDLQKRVKDVTHMADKQAAVAQENFTKLQRETEQATKKWELDKIAIKSEATKSIQTIQTANQGLREENMAINHRLAQHKQQHAALLKHLANLGFPIIPARDNDVTMQKETKRLEPEDPATPKSNERAPKKQTMSNDELPQPTTLPMLTKLGNKKSTPTTPPRTSGSLFAITEAGQGYSSQSPKRPSTSYATKPMTGGNQN